MFVRRGLVLLLDGGNLGAQAFEFRIERGFAGRQFTELGVFLRPWLVPRQKCKSAVVVNQDLRFYHEELASENNP